MRSLSAEHQQRRVWARPRYWHQVGAAALLAVVLRAAFFFVPISPDEGGYLAIARTWRHGGVLYKDIWIDRPQGLLSIYRAFDVLGGTSNTVRILSLGAAVMTVVGLAEFVRSIATPAAGVTAAVLAAFISTAPAIDGFAANGELLGGAFGALALGVGARVVTKRSGARWMVAAGALAGAALSIKQSSADSLGALLIWLGLAVVFGLVPRREAALHMLRCVLGAGAVIGTLLLHGVITGWDRWFYAVLGYRVSNRSALENANWDRFSRTASDVLPVLWPVVAVSLFAASLLIFWRRQRTVKWSGAQLLMPIWVILAVAMFLSGGQFFHHYWLTLTYPLAAIGGITIGGLGLAWWRRGLVAAALVPAALSWVAFAATPRDELWKKVSGETWMVTAERLGEWLPTQMKPGDTVFVMCSMPSFYAVAEKDPIYPYMWWDSVHKPDGAQQAMIDLFTGPNPPTWVPQVFSLASCDPSGEVAQAFGERYRLVRVRYGVAIYRLAENVVGPAPPSR